MANDETVKLDISIDIRQHDSDADTGLTVTQWNALTDAERFAIYQKMRDAMAEADNGGVRVLTDGAEGL
jgi:hypothetical protein